MKLQNAHPLNPSSFRIILQFHSVKIRKNTREEYIDSDAIYIYIYTRHSSADTSPWKDRGRRRRRRSDLEGRKKEERFHRGGKSLLSLLTLEPMLSVQKAKIGRNTERVASSVVWRGRNSRDGVSSCNLLTNFLWGPKMAPPYSDWNDGQSCFRCDAVNETETVVWSLEGEGRKEREKKMFDRSGWNLGWKKLGF